ncbi:LysR family transcriptional regulator [Achromobacter sp. NPDC058515]|uniref:LysR family transcriptional regulator n=1 Tax=Achromobacter sp. NPDC058515 TaxID=3346533 RepID=UPI00365213DD
MDLSDLQIFRTVVQAGGVLRAADTLHRAQSSVTARIQALERKLGVSLFTREGRRLQLTPSGRILLDYADRLLELAREAAGAVQGDRPVGVLRVGAMESTAAARLPEPLDRFHQRYPDVALELYSGDPRDLVRQLLDSRLDAVLVAGPLADPRLDTREIYVEELVIVAEARHAPIASPRDLPKKTILAFHPGCPHRLRLEEWFARGHAMPERIVEMGSYHLILGCVAVGMGVALVPRSVLAGYAEKDRLSIHRLPARFGSVKTRLAWRKDAPQAKVLALAEVLLER